MLVVTIPLHAPVAVVVHINNNLSCFQAWTQQHCHWQRLASSLHSQAQSPASGLCPQSNLGNVPSMTLPLCYRADIFRPLSYQVPPFSFHPYNSTTLFLYPTKLIPFIFLYFPLFHMSQNKTKQHSFCNSMVVHSQCCHWRTLVNLDDPPRTPHTNSGASSSLHSHGGVPGVPGEISKLNRRHPSSSARGTEILRVQLSPSKEPLHQGSMSHAERSSLLSSTLVSNSLLTSLRFKKTSCLPAEET